MRRVLILLLCAAICFTATAQMETSIVVDGGSLRAVQTDALTGVNIDPIGLDHSRQACARVKIKFDRMTKAQIDALVVKMRSNTDLTKQKVADYYDNVLILEMTAKPNTRFYFYSPEFGESNEVTLNLEGNREYEMLASLNQTFSIVINSNVVGADVYIDGAFKGKTDDNFSCTVSDVMIGGHTLKLTYGSVSHEQVIEVNKSSISFRQNVDTAASQPQFVVFAVEPQSAVVTIEGKHYSLTDGAMRLVLESGTYNYTVSAAGYHSQSGTFTVAGSKVTKQITLTADVATVTLTVADNAEIWVNGEKVGNSHWSGKLNSGTYIFEAKKAGHSTTTTSKRITSDNPQQSYTLDSPKPLFGSLIVDGSPLMADVVVDGKAVGQLPLKLGDILVGEHTVVVSKSGYETYTQSVTIADGKTATINATLTKQVAQVPNTPSSSSANFGDIEMVYVKGGTFTMGATSEQGSDANADEKPTHSVTLSDYYIGKYEVTQAQWRAVMGSNPIYFTGNNLPVENVSWTDIQEFIQKLNKKTGKNFRLPTEAEWEYAARGGNQSKGYKYSGSNTLDDVAWYTRNSSSKTHPVGQKQPNELGVYDMTGNVLEWCQDWYGSYSSSSQTNPTGPSSGSGRVLRGGSWHSSVGYCRVSYRGCDYSGYRCSRYGFRLVCSPDFNTPMSTSVATTTTTTTTTKTYKVGDYYNDGVKEGVVFEVSADGRHGKIVSMKQSSGGLLWSSDSAEQKRLIGGDSETDGAYNMAKVKAISGWRDKYPAFKWCADLGEGWYLPSIEELKVFTLNTAVHDAVNRTLIARDGKKLYDEGDNWIWYWSSTEYDYQYSKREFCARGVYMNDGCTGLSNKSRNYYVRAVSAF